MTPKRIWPILAFLLLLMQISCAPQAGPMSLDAANTLAEQTIEAILTQRNIPVASETPSLAQTATQTPSGTPTQTRTNGTTTPTDSNLIGSCYTILGVQDVTIRDGTRMDPGTGFIKTWNLSNGGTCEWPADTKIVFVSGELMGGSAKTLGTAVPAGGNINISLSLTAPSIANTYRGNWMLALSNGTRFGLGKSGTGMFWVEIIVTSTSTLSITPTLTASGTFASQSPTPSSTPSSTPTITGQASTSTYTSTASTTSTHTATNTPTQTTPPASDTPTMTPTIPAG